MTRHLTAYAAGYACGKRGPNTINCHFSHFSSPEKTRDWARGKRDAEAEQSERSPWFPATTRPALPGWYEVSYAGKPTAVPDRLFWRSGKWWTQLDFQLIWPKVESWRGLAKMP